MLAIKLSRIGKKNNPLYRVIITEKGRDPYGKALEILGSYNPHSKDLQCKADRIQYWISNGATMTTTVNNLFIEKKIITGEKIHKVKISNKRKEKMKAAEEKKA